MSPERRGHHDRRKRRQRGSPTVVVLVENLAVPFDRRVWQEVQALKSANYRVHVICPRSRQYPKAREQLNGIMIHRYRPVLEARNLAGYLVEYGVAVCAMFVTLLSIALRGRIDVIQACNPPDLLFVPALPFLATGRTKFVFDQHDACPELMMAKGQPEGGIAVRVTRICERITFRLADVSIATNQSYRKIAIERGSMQPSDVFVVRSGPDHTRFADAEATDSFHFGHRYLVAYVGVMGIQDGVDYLLDAADHIVNQVGRTDVQFTLAGDGPEFARLCARVRSMGLEEHVRFLGRIPEDELGSLLVSSDICVNPDEFNEMNDISTMNKVIEYMAVGKPIVQFDLTEGRVSAGEASLYVKANDSKELARSICELLEDPGRRAVMGGIGQERVRDELAWEHQVPVLLAAYDRALGGRRQGGE